MTYKPHRLEPNYPAPEVVTMPSPAPPIVVERWCIGVERMNRRQLDDFTRRIWRKFGPQDLEPLKWAISTAPPRAGASRAAMDVRTPRC